MSEVHTHQTQAYTALSNALLSGAYRPGQPLTINRVSKDIGYAITPTRYAVRRLCAHTALELLPSRSVRVPVLQIDEFWELVTLTYHLEIECLSRIKRNSWNLDISKLLSITSEYEGLLLRGDYKSANQLPWRFWQSFYALSGSQILQTVLEKIWRKLGPIFSIHLDSLDEAKLWGENRLQAFRIIVAGLQAHDASLIEGQLESIIDRHKDWYPKFFKTIND